MPKQRDRPLLEALLTNVEAITDSLTDNEAVRSVPVIGTAFKVCKGLDDLRSRTLAAKLERFLTDSVATAGISSCAPSRETS